MIALFLMAQTMETRADGIPQAIPATGFSCEMSAADGTRFTVAGTTPAFPKGWDPNHAAFVQLQGTHPEAFQRKVGVDPGEAGDWFREYQVSSGYPGVTQYTTHLMLRKEGASIAYMTRYLDTGKRVPYEYYAVGLCTASFAPATDAKGAGQ